MAESKIQNLTSGKLLARNTIYSLIGQGAPLFIAIFSIPLLIKGLGTDRFGILTIAWIVISYFSLFDLGLGRALTQLVAEKLGRGQAEELPPLIWTASVLMLFMGLVGTGIVVAIAPWLVQSALKIPLELQAETLQSFYLLAISIPIVTSTAGFVGILSALQRFDLINLVRIPSGLLMYLGPLLILPLSHSLVAIVGVLLVTRLCVWGIHVWQCFQCLPALSHLGFSFQSTLLKPLLKFGGWMTITNVVGPLMVYLDRFLIGSILSVTAVAYYTTPYELVSKLGIIPGAIVSVLFPAFSNSFLTDKQRTKQLFNQGLKYIYLILFPLVLIIISLSSIGLEIWLGNEFARNSNIVLQWLAFGMLFNSFAQIPFAFIQGIGRPDVTSKIHLIELPLYLFFLSWLLPHYGVNGAAAAWSIRVIIDAFILYFVSYKLSKFNDFESWNVVIAISFVMVSMLCISSLPPNTGLKFIGLFISAGIYLSSTWIFLLNENERSFVANRIRTLGNLN